MALDPVGKGLGVVEDEEDTDRALDCDAKAVTVLTCDALVELLWDTEMALDPVGKALGVVEGEEDTEIGRAHV